MSPSGLGGSGGGCIIRERGDWREAARLPALSPGENSKFGGYRRGLLMSEARTLGPRLAMIGAWQRVVAIAYFVDVMYFVPL